jgi:F-type H+-transporting ATPase subunit a
MIRKAAIYQVFTLFLFLSVTFMIPLHSLANTTENTGAKDVHTQIKELEIGDMIMDHIVDSYEWHLFTYKGHSYAIYLPVILYDQGHWMVFSSRHLYHHNGHYKGYYIAEAGSNVGKLVRKDAQDKEVLPQWDLSITKTIFAIFINAFLVVLIFLSIARSYKKREGKAPKGLQSLVEPLILFIRDDVAKASIGEEKFERYVPYLMTLFFFILFSNLFGIFPFFPGGANVTGNIAVTGVMAFFTFVITTVSGNKHYWTDIFNTPGVPWWLKVPVPLMPFVEVLGIFTKPFVLAVRLFANMVSGHIVLAGFISLIFIFGKMSVGLGYGVSVFSMAFAIFLDLLEVLVAFIQAYVFVLLSALYFGMATEVPEHH